MRFLTRGQFAFLLLCALWPWGAGSASSQDLGERETVFAYNGDGGDVGRFVQIRHDTQGNLHAAYFDATNADLKYGKGTYNSATGELTWDFQTVDSAGDVGRFCSIDVDPLTDRPVIMYHDATNGNLKVAWDQNNDGDFEQDGTVFGVNDDNGFAEIDVVDDTSFKTGIWTSIDIDRDGRFHVSYQDDTNGVLRYARHQSFVWTLETIPDPAERYGRYSQIVVDDETTMAFNIPMIVYQDETNLILRGALKSAAGNPWAPVPVGGTVDPETGTGFFIDAEIDQTNEFIYVTYQQAFPDQAVVSELRMAVFEPDFQSNVERVVTCEDNGTGCQFQNPQGPFGFYTSVTVNGSFLPRIAHRDDIFGELLYERRQVDGTAPPATEPRFFYDFKARPEIGPDIGLWSTTDHFAYVNPAPVDMVRIGMYDASRRALMLHSIPDDNITTNSGVVIDGGKAGEFSSVVVDGSGIPVVSYFDAVQGALFLTERTGVAPDPWASRQLVDNSDNARSRFNGLIDNIAIQPEGFAETGVEVSSIIDPAEVVHLAYHDRIRSMLNYATFDLATGSATPVNFFDVDVGPDRGQFVDVAMNENGTEFAVAYFQDFSVLIDSGAFNDPLGNGPLLRVAVGDGRDNWDFQLVDNEGDVGRHCSIVADGSVYHVAYLDSTNFNLKYARGSGGVWNPIVVEDSPNLDGLYTDIAINTNTGQPAISYYDATAGALKYAELIDGAFLTQTVDEAGDVGLFTKLVFDPVAQTALILYYDKTNGALKLAGRPLGQNRFTSFQTVDDVGDVGVQPDAAFDEQTGQLFVSYYDAGAGDLLFKAFRPTGVNRADPQWREYR